MMMIFKFLIRKKPVLPFRVKFAQEMEELDLKIIRDRKEFKHYLVSLIYAEEYNKLRRSVTNIYETLESKSNYEDGSD